MSFSFDFSISFSRECRAQAKNLADLLSERGANVFIDNYYLANLLGEPLDESLGWAFGPATRFFVPFVSAGYGKNQWPQYEWSVAKQEAQRRHEAFILPLRTDDTILVGLPDTICYLDLRNLSLPKVAEILLEKLKQTRSASEHFSHEQEWVVTFGLNMEDLNDVELPSEAPSELPSLYDWLIEDLVSRLLNGGQRNMKILEDQRTGEMLSVRFSYTWIPAKGAMDFCEIDWWELLELLPYKEVYGNHDL